MLTALFGQRVAIFVLDESVEVQVGDALTNAGFAHMQVGVFFNALPKVALQHGQTDVTLILNLVHVNDVENHVVVFVQGFHGFRRLVDERFEWQERTFPLELWTIVRPRCSRVFHGFFEIVNNLWIASSNHS